MLLLLSITDFMAHDVHAFTELKSYGPWCAQIDLRSDYERRQDGLGLLVKNAHVIKVGRRKGAATLQVLISP